MSVTDGEEVRSFVDFRPSPAALEFYDRIVAGITWGLVSINGVEVEVKNSRVEALKPAPKCRFKSGVEFDANLKIIEHPEGRFERPDGTRYDVVCLDLLNNPSVFPPPFEKLPERYAMRGQRYYEEKSGEVQRVGCKKA